MARRSVAEVTELIQRRNQVLMAAYEITDGGDPSQGAPPASVCDATGLSKEDVAQAFRWVLARGLATSSLSDSLWLTPAGVDRAEELMQEQESQDDPASAAAVLTVVEYRTLERFIQEVRGLLESAPLDPEDRADAEAQLDTIEAQMRSPRPRRRLIGMALGWLKAAGGAAVGGALGNAAYAGIVSLITR
jgi:hypothetical protein